MKYSLLLSLALALVPAATWSAELDDGAVRKLSEKYTTAWNAGDAAGVAALYAQDAVLTMSDGRTMRGRAEIQTVFDEVMKSKGRLTISADEARALGSDAGVWRCEWKRAEPKGGSPRGTRLAVLAASKDGWLIIEDLVALSPAGSAPKKAPHSHGEGEHGHEHGPGDKGHAH
jgi:uncharacterized protein (TIGR02246 family)